MSCAPCDTPDKQCADRNDFFFSRGPGTFRVATNLHAEARAALVSRMGPSPGVVLMRGGLATCRNDSDHEELFRQESYFAYLFGVDEPDWWGMIELPSGRTSLFIPRLDPSYAIWMGEIKTPNAFRQKYRVDAVLYADELKAAVAAALAAAAGDTGTPLVHTLRGTNSDSGQDIGHALPTADGLPTGCAPCEEVLYATLAECRVIKSAAELQVMAYVSWLSSMAHVEVRRTCVLVLVVAACNDPFLTRNIYGLQASTVSSDTLWPYLLWPYLLWPYLLWPYLLWLYLLWPYSICRGDARLQAGHARVSAGGVQP